MLYTMNKVPTEGKLILIDIFKRVDTWKDRKSNYIHYVKQIARRESLEIMQSSLMIIVQN